MSLPPNWVAVADDAGDEYYWNRVTNETTWERPAPPPPPNKPSKPPKPMKPPRPHSEMPTPTEAKVAVGAARPYSEIPRFGAESKRPVTEQKLSTSPITTNFRAALSYSPRTTAAPAPPLTSTASQRRPSWGSKLASGEPVVDTRNRKRTYTNEAEVAERLNQLQILFEGAMVTTGKRLLREGPLQKHNRDGIKPYQFFLFEDMLVYAKSNVLNDNYTLNRQIPLTTCITAPHEPGKPPHSFVILSRQKSFHLQGENLEESNSWKEAIEQAARAAQRAAGIRLTAVDCAPLWAPNEDAQECQLCSKPFGLMNRRHHCRNCGKCVCQACAIDKVRIARIDPKELFKVCNPCSREIKSQRKYGVQALQS